MIIAIYSTVPELAETPTVTGMLWEPQETP